MTIVIIEDERMAANRLVKMLNEINPQIEVEATLGSIEETTAYFQNNAYPDLMLMDVQLSDGISFDLFDLLEIKSPVVFTTAYDEYAIQAFRVNASDYLLKPIKKKELKEVLDRQYEKINEKILDQDSFDHPLRTRKVLIKMGQSLKVLTLDEAAYYYSENKITFYMSAEGKRYPIDFSLDKLEEELDSQHFFRVNRQFIIRQDNIVKMTSYSTNRIKLTMNPNSSNEIIVSKDKVSRFRKWLVS